MPAIRKACVADAGRLAEIAEATFRATFGGVNSPEDMELHCRNNFGERIQHAEISSKKTTVLLSENEGALIGFAQLHWGDFPACIAAARPGEIRRLYVREQWHGRGVAQDLMEASFAAIAERGSDAAWLGVWEENPRAIAFYGKLGFVEVGKHRFKLGNDPQTDIVMVRPTNGWHGKTRST